MNTSLKAMSLTKLVTRFLQEMVPFDAGRMLPMLHTAKLTATQLAVLEFVFEPRTVSGVASFVGLSRPATSQMIHKLVHRGLVRRSEGARDRREKAVVLSARGKTLLRKVASARAAQIGASTRILPHRSAGRLRVALRDAVRQMEKAAVARKKPFGSR
jgi:DNA-binding MarR family transcriptional regulator